MHNYHQIDENGRMYFFTDMLIDRPITIHSTFNDEAIHATKNQNPIAVFDDVGIILRLTRLVVDTIISLHP